ncbi:galactokinase [Gracilibacillus halophilus YIM-C55.5]|uniref:Galactokinase n=1 Tax=Gracilibacillus halophilus YIM-C55.5 TaxID=1308866 RepID=N4WBP0_9BACI|nr:galactokinase [Gracilibacillus halophilus]ENH97713.1 galactokinase [Gracilibacillus halophilus YIM-C55.5]
MDKLKLIDHFKETFQTDVHPRIFFAPGRINLIGEHTDYNGGHVFPAAISFGTYACVKPRKDRHIRFYSVNFPEHGMTESSLDSLADHPTDHWTNYPKGMFYYLLQKGYSIDHGLDILFYGNIPNGAGLSSSASIELVTGVIIEEMFSLNIDRMELVRIGQQVENDYIGVNTGIMDQFAIGMGKKDHAMLLDCDTLDYEYAPIQLEKHDIIIINTNKRRELADSKYNERRQQCEEAVCDLQQELNIKQLGELTPKRFEAYRHLIQNEINQQRAKHAVYENARTIDALKKLRAGELQVFGELVNQSHISLRDDYEVTGLELDTITEAAWAQPGVIGARMTGAGFGGCAIAIVAKENTAHVKQEIKQHYQKTIGYEPSFYVAAISDGAKEIK